MAAGDVQMAALTVGPLDTGKNATVLFYKVSSNKAILHYSTSGQTGGSITDIRSGEQLTAYPFFYWEDKDGKSQVKWGTAANDDTHPFTTLADAGITLPAVPLSSSNAAVASSTQGASAPPVTSGTPTPIPTSSAGAPSTVLSGSPPTGTSTSTQIPKPVEKHSDGFSSGAAAGIAIGCLIAGALIAGLVFWFCGRKRKASSTQDYEANSTTLMPWEKGFATNAVSLKGESPNTSPPLGVLPLPLEDKAITGEISRIGNSIKNHVQSYYQMGRVSQGLIDMDDIHAIGSNQPISAGTLSTLLGNSATREIALRFCIAWAVCSRMKPTDDPRATLLPVEVVGCYQKIANEHKSSPAHASARFARWRVMTAELMQASFTRGAFGTSDSRTGSIQAAVIALDNVLRPFADSRMDNGERKQNLEEIMKRSALFAFTMFSQPSTWDFDWQQGGAFKSGELCVFPSLVQLSDESGQPVSPPRPFSEAVVRRLDE